MSVSASAENLATEAQSCDGGSMCLELALEGERLCKAGDCRAGVAFFLAAIQAGTDDLRTLSAIYSQLGNAYFYLGDYAKAMQYHKHDLTLARTMNDKLGEAKASGNLGNTLKVMGKFAEATQCCRRHLELARALGDRRSEGRALYNLGNVFHAQGKALARAVAAEPARAPQDVRDALTHALHYYEENLKLMRELDDRAAAGRACGNLGNTCYLLGEFAQAIRYHTERLEIARDAGDKAAERRANSNLANSHIFLGQFEKAAAHYLRTLALAEELGDAAVEAQACYSLGNTYTLLREYRAAEAYHARHLAAARRLGDRVGEGRAAWSLGNAHAALGNHEKALYYATEHLAISKELGDVLGAATAQMNVSDLRRVLGLPADSPPPPAPPAPAPRAPLAALRVRRQSMDQLSLIQITPEGKKKGGEGEKEPRASILRADSEESPAESFLELLSRCQSSRYDDQRATLAPLDKENRPKQGVPAPAPAPAPDTKPQKLQRSASSGNKHASADMKPVLSGPESPATMRSCAEGHYGSNEAMLDMITELQSARMDSQRAELRPAGTGSGGTTGADKPGGGGTGKGASLPGLRHQHTLAAKPEDDFLDMIARVQGSRLEEQRTALGARAPATLPDEDFFALLMRAQATRMEDQRAEIPIQRNRDNKNGANSKK